MREDATLWRWQPTPGMDKELADHFAVCIRQPEVPALELVGQTRVVDSQAVENRHLHVMHMHGVLSDVVTIVVRLARLLKPAETSAVLADRTLTAYAKVVYCLAGFSALRRAHGHLLA